jgi:hypothetical protein
VSDYDPLNPQKSREDAEREKQVNSTQQASDIQRLMGEEWGRRLMWAWLEWGGVYRLSYTGSAEQTAFNEGNRNFGLMLLGSVMQHAPEQMAQMQAEATQAKEAEVARKQPNAFRRAIASIRR